MFQDSELVVLLFTLCALPVLPGVLRGLELPGRRLFVGGFAWMLLAYVATVLEGVVWRRALDVIEHLSYAASGLTFLAAVLVLSRAGGQTRELWR